MFTPDEYYNIVEFTGAGTRRDEVVEEIQQQQQHISPRPFNSTNCLRKIMDAKA